MTSFLFKEYLELEKNYLRFLSYIPVCSSIFFSFPFSLIFTEISAQIITLNLT